MRVTEGGFHNIGPDGDKYDAIRQVNAYWAYVNGEPAAPAEPALNPVVRAV
jgi:hypothetical protein